MIGVYDYTVILTYLSMASGSIGIIITMTGIGHPYFGTLFLMISGLLDAFDGRVARTKKNRSEFEKNFGVQIDSLSDLICFGILPASIGMALLRKSGRFTEVVRGDWVNEEKKITVAIMLAVAVFYILTALIRLAYFNATEKERKEAAKETGVEYFTGLPVTSAALVFPLTLIIHWFSKGDLTLIYFCMMFLLAILFIGDFKLSKPNKKQLAAIIVVGFAELVAILFIIFGH